MERGKRKMTVNRLPFLILLVMGWALDANAQVPCWVNHPPIPKSGNFYYRVTAAEGVDYQDAYAEAFAMAIYESYSKLRGIPVEIGSDKQAIKNGVTQTITSYENAQMRLPINKVCEYRKKIWASGNLQLYVLWQVANNALVDPKFEDFNNCD